MKNLSISKKLILGFGSVLVLLIIIVIMSINSITSISEQADLYRKYTVPNSQYMYKMLVDMRAASQYMLNAIIEDDKAASSAALEKANTWGLDFAAQLEIFTENQRNHNLDNDIEKINSFFKEASEARGKITDLLAVNNDESDAQALKIYLEEYEPAVEEVTDILTSFENVAKQNADNQSKTVENIVETSWIIMIVTVSVSVVLTLILILVIRNSILTPVKEIVKVYDEMSKGHMKNVDIHYQSKDELGKMADSIRKTNAFIVSYLQDISDKLKMMARGICESKSIWTILVTLR